MIKLNSPGELFQGEGGQVSAVVAGNPRAQFCNETSESKGNNAKKGGLKPDSGEA